MRVHVPLNVSKMVFALSACAALVLAIAPTALAQGSGWQPGPGAILDNTYSGFIDVPPSGGVVPGSGTFTVAGWFVDEAAQGWAGADNVEVWLGSMDGGGTRLAQANFAQARPDVANATGNPYWLASGFGALVNGSSVPGGPQTIYVYVHTAGKGWWWKSVNVNGGGPGTSAAPSPAAGGPPQLTITAPTEGENVKAAGGGAYSIKGKALDPVNGGTAIDVVDIWIDGERDGTGGSELGTATPTDDGLWEFSFTPTKFKSTHHNIYVYAHSKTTGQTTEVVRGFNIQG